MRRRDMRDSIETYARAAGDAGAIDLCSAVWPGEAPEFVSAALRGHIRGGEAAYPPSEGVMMLREAVAAGYGGAPVTAGNVTIASGATGALLIALAALAPPKSDVILLEPGYQLSGFVIEALGLRVRRVPAWAPPDADRGWRLDVEKVRAAIDDRVSAVIVTDPDNPSGGVLSEKDWRALAGATRRTGCRLVADRVYERYPHDANPVPTSLLLAEGVVVLGSVTKWLHAAGLRIGWVLSNEKQADEIAQASALLLGGVATRVQIGVANAIEAMPADYLAREAAAARQARHALASALSARGLDAWPTGGGLFLNVPATSLRANDSIGAWRALLEMGIGGVPSAAFRTSNESAGEAFVRLTFARDAATLGAVRACRRPQGRIRHAGRPERRDRPDILEMGAIHG